MIYRHASKRIKEALRELCIRGNITPLSIPGVFVLNTQEYSELTGKYTTGFYDYRNRGLYFSVEKLRVMRVPWTKSVLHEFCHHLQHARDPDTTQKYEEALKKYGYENNPYEVEAREFADRYSNTFMVIYEEKFGIKSARRSGERGEIFIPPMEKGIKLKYLTGLIRDKVYDAYLGLYVATETKDYSAQSIRRVKANLARAEEAIERIVKLDSKFSVLIDEVDVINELIDTGNFKVAQDKSWNLYKHNLLRP